MGAEYKNKNSLKTKKAIYTAFIELSKEHDFSDISVTDLCTKADIHRTTFYNHYCDVYAIVGEIENNIIEEIKEILKEYHYEDFFNTPQPALLRFNNYLQKDLNFFKTLIRQSESEIFLTKLRFIFKNIMLQNNEIPSHIKDANDFNIIIGFIAGGITTIYKEWLNNELKCELDEIPVIISKFIKNGLNSKTNL